MVISEDVFSLKKEYETTVFIDGTNQIEIKKGMKVALHLYLLISAEIPKFLKKNQPLQLSRSQRNSYRNIL